MIQILLLMAVFAHNDNGQMVIIEPDNLNFSHVEITTEPACEWVKAPNRNIWTGSTTATEGHFFGVVCADNQCVPYEWDFTVEQLNESPQRPPIWFRYVQLVVMILALLASVWMIWYKVVRW